MRARRSQHRQVNDFRVGQEIAAGAEFLGVDLMQHIQFVIDALKPHAEELGIKLVKEYSVRTKQLTDCSICHR